MASSCSVNLFLISHITCAVHLIVSYIKTINEFIKSTATEGIKVVNLHIMKISEMKHT